MFFRTTPIGTDFGKAYAEFLADAKSRGRRSRASRSSTRTPNTARSTGDAIIAGGARQHGIKIAPRIIYNANSTDVSAQVLQLKQAKPDVVIFVSYTSDSILYLKTMRNLDYKPPVLIGDDSGFSDPAFIAGGRRSRAGRDQPQLMGYGQAGQRRAYIVNEIYKKRMPAATWTTPSARGMQGFLALCDAINRAGSTEPARSRRRCARPTSSPTSS